MKNVQIKPQDYHRHGFDKSKLPNIAAAGYISASLLSDVRNPLKFLSDVPKQETDAMQWGTLVDCLWTTPELFDEYYACLPDDAPRRPTDAQKNAKNPSESSVKSVAWWERWERESASKINVAPEVLGAAKKAVRMLDMHPVAKEIKACSLRQITLMGPAPAFLNLPEGCKTKAMLDLLPIEGPWSDSIVDLKTTNYISENQMHEAMFTFDYVVKMAFYSIMAEAAGYGKRDRAILIWSGKQAPYEVVVREIVDLEFGKHIVLKRLAKLQTMKLGEIQPYIETDIKPMPLRDWAIEAYSRE
jgi:exodeoxyribonuclease VIII